MLIKPAPENVHVLLVDDDEVDVENVRRKFKRHEIKNPLHHAVCGIDALELLRGENNKAKLPRPYVMLIDINMPKMGGIDFLKEVRKDPELQSSIAFFLTTSSQDVDVNAAYSLNAAGYFVKDDLDDLINIFTKYREINKFP